MSSKDDYVRHVAGLAEDRGIAVWKAARLMAPHTPFDAPELAGPATRHTSASSSNEEAKLAA